MSERLTTRPTQRPSAQEQADVDRVEQAGVDLIRTYRVAWKAAVHHSFGLARASLRRDFRGFLASMGELEIVLAVLTSPVPHKHNDREPGTLTAVKEATADGVVHESE